MKNTCVIHHSAINIEELPEQFDSIKRSHKEKGWGSKSAYHLFIEADGKVKNGRNILLPSAGTRDWKSNWTHLHICLAGNFEEEYPTEWQTNVLKTVLRAHKIDKVLGHRDISPSKCPGFKMYSKLNTMIENVPEWAREACEKAKKNGVITKNFNENIPAYRLCAILNNLGLLD